MFPHTLKGTPPRDNVNLIDPWQDSRQNPNNRWKHTPPQVELAEPMQIDIDYSHIAHTQPITNNTPTGII
jgi:hypothetical protein